MTEPGSWVLPEAIGRASASSVVTTGPSGLLLGHGSSGPITIRLFRQRPTRLMLATPAYVTWLLAFRCISLGAHLTIVAGEPRRWQGLVDAVAACGGTAEFSDGTTNVPSQGRPYRPSLIVDDSSAFDGSQVTVGPWQAVMMTEDASSSGAIHSMRSCDMALVSPCDAKATENLRRAYVLNQRQTRQCADLQQQEVVLAMPRRLVRLSLPPTPTESRVVFRQ